MKNRSYNSRREFLLKSALWSGATLTSSSMPIFSAFANDDLTVGDIMDRFIQRIPHAPFAQTVDTLKSGTRDQKVTGVVTTMFATVKVIQKSIELGANFIIAHEPTFYNHLDETDWLEEDDVFKFKRDLLEQNQIALWRNHDYIHSMKVDGIQIGVVNQLGWNDYYKQNAVLNIPKTTLKGLIDHMKDRLDVPAMRYVGDLNQPIEKVLLLPGAIGGRRQIEMAMKENPDVIIVGEAPEWETPEYVRNANEMGKEISYIATGHSASEEGGGAFMADWIRKNYPELPVHHLPSKNSLEIY